MGEMADYFIEQMTSGRMPVGSTRKVAPRNQSKKENVTMDHNVQNIQAIAQAGQVTMIQIVEVEFLNNNYKQYDFFTDLELLSGDLVVCETSNGPSLARVVIMKSGSDKATKWIIDRVDTEAHDARMAREKYLKEIKGAMDRKLKAETELEKYQKLAEKDPEMRALLDTYVQVKASAPQVIHTPKIPPRNKPKGAPDHEELAQQHGLHPDYGTDIYGN